MKSDKLPNNFIAENKFGKYRHLFEQQCKPAVYYPAQHQFSLCGQTDGTLHYLIDGMIKIYTTNADGYEKLIGFQKQDTIFQLDKLYSSDPAVISILAITPVLAIPITSTDIRMIASQNEDFLDDFLIYMSDTLRLMCYDAETQSIGDVPTRLAHFLLLYMQTEDFRKNHRISLTQENLASAVNASRVQVSRTCSIWKKAGIIRVERGQLDILDINRLMLLAR